jgi:hypothetical protein
MLWDGLQESGKILGQVDLFNQGLESGFKVALARGGRRRVYGGQGILCNDQLLLLDRFTQVMAILCVLENLASSPLDTTRVAEIDVFARTMSPHGGGRSTAIVASAGGEGIKD